MSLSIIAAVGKKGEIGIEGRLPWRLPEDLRRFKEITTGHSVIMGRKTYESIGHPLPDRHNIIVTRNKEFSAPGCTVVYSLEEAVELTSDETETFIIGGSEIFSQALPFVEKMYITAVDKEFTADTFFPGIDLSEWEVTEVSAGHRSEAEAVNFSYLVCERKRDMLDLSNLKK